MSYATMANKIARVLGSNPELAFELYCMASEVVDDFEDYGPVLQADEHGEYSEATTLRRLQTARNEIKRHLAGLSASEQSS
jgi:hypothetical protein